jgi:hypothetical protein
MSYWKDKYKQDFLTAVLVVLTPFIIYIHLLFSSDSKEIVIFNYVFEHGVRNNQTYVWILLNDFIPFSLLLIMFFTSRDYWKYFLLPLLSFYLLGMLFTLGFFTSFYEGITSFRGIGIVCSFCLLILTLDQLIFQKYRQKIINLKLKSILLRKYEMNFKTINKKVGAIRKEKSKMPQLHYLRKIYYLKTVLSNTLSIDLQDSFLPNKRKNQKLDAIIIFLLLVIIGIWFIADQIPSGIMEIEVMGIEINNNGFKDLSVFIWFISRKLIVIIFLSIWFISCPHWWKYAILSPFILYSFQFWEAFQDVQSLDSYGNIKVFPIVFLMILILISLSKLARYRSYLKDCYEYLTLEIEDVLNKLSNKNLELSGRQLQYEKLKNDNIDEHDFQIRLQKLVSFKQDLLNQLEVNL